MIIDGLSNCTVQVLGDLHVSNIPVDFSPVWSSTAERSRKAKALELVITESICKEGLQEYCAARTVLTETAAEVVIAGRMRGKSSSPGEDVKIEGFVKLA